MVAGAADIHWQSVSNDDAEAEHVVALYWHQC